MHMHVSNDSRIKYQITLESQYELDVLLMALKFSIPKLPADENIAIELLNALTGLLPIPPLVAIPAEPIEPVEAEPYPIPAYVERLTGESIRATKGRIYQIYSDGCVRDNAGKKLVIGSTSVRWKVSNRVRFNNQQELVDEHSDVDLPIPEVVAQDLPL